jgi:cytochrome c biogenesis protein CcmG/thiol:disulfide interchange protein DsbE
MSADPPVGEPDPPEEARPVRRIVFAVLAAIIVGGFIALLVVGLTAGDVDTSIDSAIAKGELKEAPEFTLPVLANGAAVGKRDGEPLSLSELRGRPVVVNFWASWCDPCEREAPILEDAWRSARGRGAVVLGIDVQDLSGNALDFIAEYGQTYPHVRDKSDDTYRAYGLTGIPETFFLDRAGRVRVHWVGEINADQIADGLDVILPEATR